MKNKYYPNLLMLCAIILLSVAPLIIVKPSGGTFSGADEKAKSLINELYPNYKAWFTPVIEPPSSEVASLLFCLQAAIGAGILGYNFGLARGRARLQANSIKKDFRC
ncbi:MAG: energy-coupling factor ABC transporter substrate-binding protein [Oligoflexia bacterium]|nr:energy-coupling factor ABC transporter substrate-binding protein [Oligoflexia bacterium]